MTNTNKNFEKTIILGSLFPNIFTSFIILVYAAFSTQLPMSLFVDVLKITAITTLVMQFTAVLLTDHFAYRKISRRLSFFKEFKTTIQERTKIFEELMQYPWYSALMAFGYYTIGAIILIDYIYNVKNISFSTLMIMSSELAYGIYFACLMNYTCSFRICSKYATEIINAGIEKEYVMRRKTFSASLGTQFILFFAIPFFFTCFINCMIIFSGYYPFNQIGMGESISKQLSRMINTGILNTITVFGSSIILYINIQRKNSSLIQTLKDIAITDLSKIKFIETDLSDEISYNHYLINQSILLFQSIFERTRELGKVIGSSITHLKKICNATESTSVEQSTGIKEIVSTMENSTTLSHNIENKIIEVADLAKETVENVVTGSEFLERSLVSINAISESNEITIQGIKDLNEKINSIWEVANIIDGISDQTKIIAFNAELEATNAMEQSKNFKNVSSEIRRLANSTIDSTREIKQRITEIQEAAINLLKASHDNSNLIQHGTELAVGLEDRFTNISNSAKLNSQSANEIQYLVQQQTKAFDQIVQTLQQISTSIQGFSVSTRNLIETSKNLQDNVDKLESSSLPESQESK